MTSEGRYLRFIGGPLNDKKLFVPDYQMRFYCYAGAARPLSETEETPDVAVHHTDEYRRYAEQIDMHPDIRDYVMLHESYWRHPNG